MMRDIIIGTKLLSGKMWVWLDITSAVEGCLEAYIAFPLGRKREGRINKAEHDRV